MGRLDLAIPPPVVMLVIGIVMWLLSLLFPAFTVMALSGSTVAALLGLIGLGLSMAGVFAFKRARTTIDPRKPADASVLVTSGVYRFTRNPMYLGVLLILIGWAVLLGNLLSLLCSIAFVAYISRYQIIPEELLLQKKFGAEFSAYKAKVRRWI
jgi:protein-S-isoprenylcysteine O-methyltransferase Ste14